MYTKAYYWFWTIFDIIILGLNSFNLATYIERESLLGVGLSVFLIVAIFACTIFNIYNLTKCKD